MTQARVGQAEVEQPVLQHLPTDRDRLALEHGEIRDAEHTRLVVLQEHHLPSCSVQRLPLLDAALQGAFAAVPLLAGESLLQVQQQGLGFERGRLLQHRHQHVLPHVREGIGPGSSVTSPLLLVLGLQLAPINALGAANRDPHRISRHLLAQPACPLGHVSLLDPQRQRGGHRGPPDRNRSPVAAT
jgi:hypothetical protein